jgi:hypothetical protein
LVHNVKDESKYFNNIFCSECNGISNSYLQCENVGHTEGGNGLSFSGLLKQERTQLPNESPYSNDRCSNDEIYDVLTVFFYS